jgi:hypothetical protein
VGYVWDVVKKKINVLVKVKCKTRNTMKTLDKLKELKYYYMATRNVGHTTLMKEGFINYSKPKAILSTHLVDYQEFKCNRNEVVSLESLDRLRGSSRSLAIDNGAMIVLLTESINTIEKLEEENRGLNNKIREIKEIIQK